MMEAASEKKKHLKLYRPRTGEVNKKTGIIIRQKTKY